MKRKIIILLSLCGICLFSAFLSSCKTDNSNGFTFDEIFVVNNKNLYVEVNNSIDSFDFNNKIIVNNDYSYTLYKDKEGLFEVSTNVIDLSVGDNVNYLLIRDSKQNKTLYTVNVRRLPIYTVSLYYYDDYESSYWPTHHEEKTYIVEKKFYKSIQVQERDKVNLSNERPNREGYNFLCWDYNNTEILGDTSIYGLWEGKKYTVTVINGSETIKHTATYGEYLRIDIPQKPIGVDKNYSFKGCSFANESKREYYYIDSSGRFVSSADWQPIRFTVTKDITVTAHWG